MLEGGPHAPRRIHDVDAVVAPTFALGDDVPAFSGAWHTHRRHQVLYAAGGVMHLEVEGGQWLLPPQVAAWIPAGFRHAVCARAPIELRTVYLEPSAVADAGSVPRPRVFAVTPLAREMILYAMRWGPEHDPGDPVARRFFAAFAALVEEWVAGAAPFQLPAARSPGMARAMSFALEHLGGRLTVRDAARAAHVSTRTLARRFVLEANMSFAAFVRCARMLRAMDLLRVEGTSVGEVALEVGFRSFGAFTHAFTRFAGETPRSFKKQLRRPAS